MKALLPLFSLIAFSFTALNAAQLEAPPANEGPVRLVPVDPTPEPGEVQLSVIFPKYDQMKTSSKIGVQLKVEGYPIGVDSDFPRKKRIANDPNGQSIHVLIDDEHYIPEYEDLTEALQNQNVYYNARVDFEIPFELKPGLHVIRAFPVRSYYESLKGSQSFVASVFYYKTKDNPQKIDLNKPYLTYNEPIGDFDISENKPILLDFLVTNCRLSPDGYKVKVTIDGDIERTITSWQPYYIYGLKKGTHKVRMQLLDSSNKQVPGHFNDVTETFKLR